MKLADEELQNKIEQGLAESNADAQAYKQVFKILKRDPEFNLPIQFADRLVSVLEKKEERGTIIGLLSGFFFQLFH